MLTIFSVLVGFGIACASGSLVLPTVMVAGAITIDVLRG